MPLYQNTSVTANRLLIGNYKIETAAYGTSAGGTWVNLGAGMVNNFNHAITKYDVQAGNAPDPIEGVAEETFTIDMELIEYDASVLAAVSCGLVTADTTTSSTQSVYKAGGNTILTNRAFKLTNRRLVSGATKETVILVFKATIDNGLSVTAKSDNDTDPINVMPVTVTAKLDSTLSVGSQLYTITHPYTTAGA